jgi:hypothetical protein
MDWRWIICTEDDAPMTDRPKFKQNLWTLYAVYRDGKIVGHAIAETDARENLPFAREASVRKVISGYARVTSYRDYLRELHPNSPLVGNQ